MINETRENLTDVISRDIYNMIKMVFIDRLKLNIDEDSIGEVCQVAAHDIVNTIDFEIENIHQP